VALSGRTFFRLRVTTLLVVLVVVLLWGWRDVMSRRERNTWQRPLSVALVLGRRGAVTPAAVQAFRERVAGLDTRLAEECRRYTRRGMHPFAFTVFGPVDVAEGPPAVAGDGFLDAAQQAWAMWRWSSAIDDRAAVDSRSFDSRIYVVARPPASAQRELIEGESEAGGRLGIVEVELDDSMADFALFVATHELFHTLGATDKYDADGHTALPSGLAEPDLRPTFPQRFAEVMARNRPVEPGVEVPPLSLDELAVGPTTAAEIGWLR
jgi:hypothetical protein